MTISAQTFVSCLPSTEEEMLAICQEICRREGRKGLSNAIEVCEQLADVLAECKERLDNRKAAK